MPNKLTDAEVKKALEEYIEFSDFEYTEYTSIRIDVLQNALDLIDRQDQENESLKAEVERLKGIITNAQLDIEDMLKRNGA